MADARQEGQGKFVTGSLMRHVVTMSLAGALGLSFTFLVDFLALFWISRRGIESEMAAVGIAGTIQFGMISLSVGMMIGAVALVSRAIATTAMGLTLATGILWASAVANVAAGLLAAVLAWRYIRSLQEPAAAACLP